MRYYLVTFHGMFVRRDVVNGTIAQIVLEEITDRDSLVSLDLPPEITRPVYQDFISNRPSGAAPAQVRHLGLQILHIDYVAKTISLEHDGRYLSAQPNGLVHQDRTWVRNWERFVLCSDEDMDFLFFLRTNTWIVKSTRAVVPGDSLKIGNEAALEFANLRIPLALNMPLDRRTFPFRWLPLVDGWRIEELVLFKPMIYYVAFGKEHIFEELCVSLRSLAQIGHFGGKVLIFTDRAHGEICERVPWLVPEQIHVARIPAQDKVGYVAGRYCILEEPEAHQYQPVVYMDTDIVFNTSVEPLLVAMAVSDRLTAPLESFSELARSPSVGAELLQLDNAQPRYACGFNCGTVGIPNLPMHAHTLELIRRIVSNLISIRGRNAGRWIDQPVANYVSYKHANFDTNEVSQAVRSGSRQDATRLGPLSGLVHFWVPPPAERAEVMQQYLSLLLTHCAATTSSRRPTPGEMESSMIEPSAIYDRSFFESRLAWRIEFDAIAEILLARFTFLSVIDMGCGSAFIIARLARLGKEVIGIDASSHAIASAPEEIRPRLITADLTKPLRLGRYDLVICSEVAEHLEAAHSDILVDNICGNSAGLVFFTAATPGQGGHGHVNEQPHDYWIAKFAERGFRLDGASTSSLRDDLSRRINTIWWFKKNALIFRV